VEIHYIAQSSISDNSTITTNRDKRMNDYSFNRAIIDLLDLLQDLSDYHRHVYIFNIYGTGAVELDFFVTDSDYKLWVNGEQTEGHKHYRINKGDCEASMQAFNDLVKNRKIEVDL